MSSFISYSTQLTLPALLLTDAFVGKVEKDSKIYSFILSSFFLPYS